MSIFVNRSLNMKQIKAIGLDMDYTLVRYKTEEFEKVAYEILIQKLIELKNYPKEIRELKFEFKRAIRGLVLDKRRGNLLKLSLYAKVKISYHGTRPLDFSEQQALYRGLVIDLNDPQYTSIDTSFSLSHAILFAQLVSFKDERAPELPDYFQISDDILEVLDLAHRDESLKGHVKKDLKRFVHLDPEMVGTLERFKLYQKKLMLITNSDFDYTRKLMDFTFNPFLKNHKSWMELFDIVITQSQKPRFFTDRLNFLKVHPDTGLMSNQNEPLQLGQIYQNGHAEQLQKDLGLDGEEILYLGDHIFGDILKIKKSCNWRTALVIEEIEDELRALDLGEPSNKKISDLMLSKEALQQELDELYSEQFEQKKNVKEAIQKKFDEIKIVDAQISPLIQDYQKLFNPYWGEVMRSGLEESRFAGQVEKYACIYMAKIANFSDFSPRKYFRPHRRVLPHEIKD